MLLTSGMLPLMMTGTLNVSVMVTVLAVAVMVTGGSLDVLPLAELGGARRDGLWRREN